MNKVLLIEDDEVMRLSIKQSLELEDIQVIATPGLEQAKTLIRSNFNGIILSDIRMPRFDGFDVLQKAKNVDPELPVVLITGEADVPMAISAMKKGAYDFIEKPCPTSTLLEAITRALKQRASTLDTRRLQRQIASTDTIRRNFVGKSAAIKEFRHQLRASLNEQTHILLTGENGSGKRLAADAIAQARRELGPVLHISLQRQDDCKTIKNRSDLATLCVHQITQLTTENLAAIASYAKENQQVRIIGCDNHTDFLVPFPFFNSFEEIKLPNIADRAEDLPEIFEVMVREIEQNLGFDVTNVTAEIIHYVRHNNWKGNLSELRQFARAYVLGGQEKAIHKPDTHSGMMQNFERLIIAQALKASNGSATQAAQSLGLPRKTFYDRMKKLEVSRSDIMARKI